MDDYATCLREKGLRATSQRVVLLKLMSEIKGHRHLTASEIYDMAAQTLPGLNLATVYRTLDGLHEAGLVDRLAAGMDQIHYSYRDPEHLHGHLCCHSCGNVETLDYRFVAEFAATLKERFGFRLADSHLGLPGLCQKCNSKTSKFSEGIR